MKAIAQPMTESPLSIPAARLAIASGAAVNLLLASLHVLSPEFDPSCFGRKQVRPRANSVWFF